MSSPRLDSIPDLLARLWKLTAGKQDTEVGEWLGIGASYVGKLRRGDVEPAGMKAATVRKLRAYVAFLEGRPGPGALLTRLDEILRLAMEARELALKSPSGRVPAEDEARDARRRGRGRRDEGDEGTGG